MNYVQFDLFDKPRKIRFDVNAIADYEDKTGISFLQSLGEETMGFRTLRNMLWAGLKWEDRGLTVERVGNYMQTYFQGGGDLQTLSSVIVEAITKSGIFRKAGEQDESPEGNVKTEAAN